MKRTRRLVVTADDFGIGPMTSAGILDLAARRRVTCAVLLVNSPHAAPSVLAWRRAGMPMELGWHPCLTLDGPVSKPSLVPSLVDPAGRFHPLGAFAARLATGRVRSRELRLELQAQYDRLLELVGVGPVVVNAHHHVQTFPVVAAALADVLARARSRPYVRRVREPLATLYGVRGARVKRSVLNVLGRLTSRRFDRLGFPANDWLAGVADNPAVADPDFFARWLAKVPGRDVELMCHPGWYDESLEGRDGSARDGGLARRVREMELLGGDAFPGACARAGFTLTAPTQLPDAQQGGGRHAA